MDTYSPSQVTHDSDSEDSDSARRYQGFHDDRDAVDYEQSLTRGETSLLKNRFSDDEAVISQAVMKPTSTKDLRSKLKRKRTSRRNSSRDGSRERSKSRDRSHHTSSRHRSYHRSDRRSRTRSNSRSKGSSRKNDRSRSRDRSRRRSSERSRCKKSSYYKEDNLDIEIRIKNESRSKSNREESSQRKDNHTSPISKMYTKYTEEHHKRLADFKKSLEKKFNVSVDSIVSGILSTKSSTEIKDLLKVDIDTVSSHSQVSCKSRGKIVSSSPYEQCMHCGELFSLASPPGYCVKCRRPRDEQSLEAILPFPPPRHTIAPPPMHMSVPPGPIPLMPPGPMPMVPPASLFHMPQGPMPSFPPNIGGIPPNIGGIPPNIGGIPPVNETPSYPPPLYIQPAPAEPSYHSQPALPSVRGHTLLPRGQVPLNLVISDCGIVSKRPDKKNYSVPNSDQKDKKDSGSTASSRMENKLIRSRPDPQSFDTVVQDEDKVPARRKPILLMNSVVTEGNDASQAPMLRNPADLMKTLIMRE